MLFDFPYRFVWPLPQPLSCEERGERIFNIKSARYLNLLITPPSLVGKGAGGLGHTIYNPT